MTQQHNFERGARRAGLALIVAAATLASGCSLWGGSSKPKPAELGPVVPVIGVRQAWTSKIGEIGRLPLSVHVNGTQVTVASAEGTVAAIDARTGGDIWRATVGEPLSAGVGSDGKWTAVVTSSNHLVVLSAGRELWRKPLAAQVYTAPLVAGNRVFVLAADRSLSAYDAAGGARLWNQQRPGEPLVLRQDGLITAVGDTLVAGLSGRMVGFNPDNGTVRWEAPLASPRGTNDVERLVELLGRVSREGDSVCARAYQATVGCVDTSRGTVAWTHPASGSEGIHGDATMLFGTESNGTVVAWKRADGAQAWSLDKLRYRKLSAPLLLGRSVVVGDDSGLVHLLSREDGSFLNRLTTDGSGVAAPPVAAGDTLVVVTRNGGIYGFRPE
ncbi:outer membrane protein assembly factor BamB [Paracidovorax citrulli]|uniref:Outer membrane protein assembly factor BamB n=2 Tax=Paracidovorax citrulli TaxID=80869 RepID=A1TM30_PARC0|nr:outer membrane protein assembly factor BamB [Paracidovorax citrulli]ABM32018.1 Pyrrolo-quinoline quinone [Paracidovorax citrulli AAC00-1]ATG94944.1 outer membrane protein assembly factor BamB [Paracidovorax citrulli]MVT30290.1 outer membrane protein assembly factor BamB [Paracidovorax citrulli]PVY66207.1 Beta-barrel assembly machine subunit BamB [Paracidovorax citrulli]REG69620.1 Beta-barrel assembly machine subunit BamB [Paracidovorax citrulli]